MSKLELKNISVSAQSKIVARDISLIVNSGEVHILMGPNGSGKSSLVNAIFGHPKYEISGGAMLLDGKDITALTTDKKAKKGLFLSTQHLPGISGVSMANFLYRAYKEVIGGKESVLEFHKFLSDKADMFGIDKGFLNRHVNIGLSGGEKKQSEALQMAALSPKFAFLDEIDSGVDVDSLGKIFGAVKTLAKEGTGFLLITHYPNILKKITPDYVHIMKEGKIVKSGGNELAHVIETEGFGPQ